MYVLYRASKRPECGPDPSEVLHHGRSAQDPRDLHEDARDIAAQEDEDKAFAKSQDERKRAEMRFAHRENPSWLRADAAQGTFRGTRRIPFTATQPPTILSG